MCYILTVVKTKTTNIQNNDKKNFVMTLLFKLNMDIILYFVRDILLAWESSHVQCIQSNSRRLTAFGLKLRF